MRYLFVIAGLALFALGCAQSATEPAADPVVMTVNHHCPIMGGEVTADGGKTEWNGKTIGFCCSDCAPKWEALSDEQKTEKLAAADEAGADHGDHSHGEHDHS
ncbi:hypothetical protein GC197_16405 [bacterium]|nr:hypothetical protein [bacterium]